MDPFIKHFCGEWTSASGRRIVITYLNEDSVQVAMYLPGEDHPMRRPWLKNKPAESMIGTLDAETQSSLDIDLSDGTNSFCFNLGFDFTTADYSNCYPSIIRLEEEKYLEQYYQLLGDLNEYRKC